MQHRSGDVRLQQHSLLGFVRFDRPTQTLYQLAIKTERPSRAASEFPGVRLWHSSLEICPQPMLQAVLGGQQSTGATAGEVAGCSAEYLTFTISKTPAGWGIKKSQL